MHINDLNASNGSQEDDDEGMQNRLHLFASKVSEAHLTKRPAMLPLKRVRIKLAIEKV